MHSGTPILSLRRRELIPPYRGRIFGSLAADPSPTVPYNRDLADQRRKYGESMLRRGDEHLASQRAFEAEAQARLDAARQRRQEEKLRLEAAEVRANSLIHCHSCAQL